jgi:uncharacterized lipoprotein NlpE involved in copper resistance
MQAQKKHTLPKLTLIFFSLLLSANHAMAATDLSAQEGYARALAKNHQQDTDHSAHVAPIDKSQDFHGVFYGFLPCKNCNGIKTTLSLKQNNLYLLVTQPAKESSKEFYEKGKYTWNDENHTVVLTPRTDAPASQYQIQDEGTLILLNSDGTPMTGGRADSYTLRRSDSAKTREVHIH